MNRREFITLLGSATAWPVAARAQQAAVPVIGYLDTAWPGLRARRLQAFHQGMSETGYVEGRNVALEYRFAEGEIDRVPAMAADLARRQVAAIVSGGFPSAKAAQAETRTIPVVFMVGLDPVEYGLVASLNRPGGNLTGVSTLNVELVAKRLELLHELVPTATVAALLVNPSNPNSGTLSRDLQAAAHALGLELHVLHATTERDFDAVFARLLRLKAGALVIGTGGPFIGQSERLAALTVRHAVPAIFQYRDFTAAGGLMSYSGSEPDAYRLVGIYTGRILKGEKPADLPVQQATKVELIINLKTAKALGLDVPPTLLARADEVIE